MVRRGYHEAWQDMRMNLNGSPVIANDLSLVRQ